VRAALVALALAAAAACTKATPAPATTGSATATASPASPRDPNASRVEHRSFHSDALGVDKHVVIYVPAGYDQHPATHYPVFYYLHGLGGDETNWVDGGKLDTTADALALQAIVVMPDGDDSFYIDSAAPIDYDDCMKTGAGLFFPERSHRETCVHANRYETYMTKDLIGWVDATYRTITTRDGRAIAGLSMGGYGAWMLALRHPDLFAAAASHSGVVSLLYAGPHPYVAGKERFVTDPHLVALVAGNIGAWLVSRFGPDLDNWKKLDPGTLIDTLEPGKLALYLDCGTEDDFKLNDAAAYVHDKLLARKIDHAYFEGPGGHNFAFWAPRLPKSLAFLRDHTTAAKS
jgi:S-formylglutathione hydrolase FrmB